MKLNQEQFDAFAMEIATFGNIPISSQQCGVGCVFCKVNSDSLLSGYPSLPQIDKEDLIRGFDFVKDTVNYVRLGAGVLVAPHTDPFLHPLIYDFIKMASERFPNKMITTVTTGTYIDESRLDYLSSISNYGIDLSLLTMQAKRSKIMAKPTPERAMEILRRGPVNKVTLMFTGELEELKRDLELIHSLGVHERARQILVRRIEHTNDSRKRLLEISKACIAGYEDAICWLKANYPDVVFTVPVLKDVFRGGNNEYFIEADERIAAQKARIDLGPDRFYNLISPESGFEYFTQAFADHPNVRVNLVRNHLYGGSVTVAGLLNHRDIREQFSPERNDVMVVPEEMYNSNGVDLLGEHWSVLAKYYGAELWRM